MSDGFAFLGYQFSMENSMARLEPSATAFERFRVRLLKKINNDLRAGGQLHSARRYIRKWPSSFRPWALEEVWTETMIVEVERLEATLAETDDP